MPYSASFHCGPYNNKIPYCSVRLCSEGKPLSDHRRNVHNLFRDLMCEMWGMILTDYLANFIENCEISGKSYSDSYLELADELAKQTSNHENPDVRKYFKRLSGAMYSWVEICQVIL